MVINFNNEVISMNDNPLREGWITATDIEAEWGIKENTMRYHVTHSGVHRQPVAHGKNGKITLWAYWREDVERVAKEQGWKKQEG